MTYEESKTQYDAYLNTHIANVQRAFQYCLEHSYFSGVFNTEEIETARTKCIPYHDKSKWDEPEYESYRQYFDPTDEEVVRDGKGNRQLFEIGWLHHSHENPHHWEHHVLLNEDDPGTLKPIEIPGEYIIEMICDWMSFSIDKNDPGEIVKWFNEKANGMTIYAESLNKILTVLGKIAEDTGVQLTAKVASPIPESMNEDFNPNLDSCGMTFTKEFSVNKNDDSDQHLNPILWDENNQLRQEVRAAIQEIVSDFVLELDDNDIPIEYLDAHIVGSNAGYNYTEHSDLDVHIIANLAEVSKDPNVLQLLYNYFKSYYNDKYDIKIHGIPVELYVEDVRSNTVSNGVYSIEKGEWIKDPMKDNVPHPEVDPDLVQPYVDEFYQVQSGTYPYRAQDLVNKLYLLRKNSIASEGEYGVGNLIFKDFRNRGYLDKLKELVAQEKSKELSVEELQESLDEVFEKAFKILQKNDHYFDDYEMMIAQDEEKSLDEYKADSYPAQRIRTLIEYGFIDENTEFNEELGNMKIDEDDSRLEGQYCLLVGYANDTRVKDVLRDCKTSAIHYTSRDNEVFVACHNLDEIKKCRDLLFDRGFAVSKLLDRNLEPIEESLKEKWDFDRDMPITSKVLDYVRNKWNLHSTNGFADGEDNAFRFIFRWKDELEDAKQILKDKGVDIVSEDPDLIGGPRLEVALDQILSKIDDPTDSPKTEGAMKDPEQDIQNAGGLEKYNDILVRTIDDLEEFISTNPEGVDINALNKALDNLKAKWKIINPPKHDEAYGRPSRYSDYKKRLTNYIAKGKDDRIDDLKQAIMYCPTSELKTSQAKELMDMIRDYKAKKGVTEDIDDTYSSDELEVESDQTFVEEGKTYIWVDKDIDNYEDPEGNQWYVASACEYDDVKQIAHTDKMAYFVIDDTEFVDWGPCDTEQEAIDFMYSKEHDYDDDFDSDDADGDFESVVTEARSKKIDFKKMLEELKVALREHFSDWDEEDYKEFIEDDPYTGFQIKNDNGGVFVTFFGEFSYESMESICDDLDKVIKKYDPEAYFDGEDAGRWSAFFEGARYDESVDESYLTEAGEIVPFVNRLDKACDQAGVDADISADGYKIKVKSPTMDRVRGVADKLFAQDGLAIDEAPADGGARYYMLKRAQGERVRESVDEYMEATVEVDGEEIVIKGKNGDERFKPKDKSAADVKHSFDGIMKHSVGRAWQWLKKQKNLASGNQTEALDDSQVADLQALADAIKAEEDTVALYETMKADHPDWADVLDDLSREEQKHIGQLQVLRDRINPELGNNVADGTQEGTTGEDTTADESLKESESPDKWVQVSLHQRGKGGYIYCGNGGRSWVKGNSDRIDTWNSKEDAIENGNKTFKKSYKLGKDWDVMRLSDAVASVGGSEEEDEEFIDKQLPNNLPKLESKESEEKEDEEAKSLEDIAGEFTDEFLDEESAKSNNPGFDLEEIKSDGKMSPIKMKKSESIDDEFSDTGVGTIYSESTSDDEFVEDKVSYDELVDIASKMDDGE